jgi:hypothetical protein
MTKQRSGSRFRLLAYQRMWQRWAWPCFLTVPASLILWWHTPQIPILYLPRRPLALVPALASLCLLIYALLARRMAWVQCRAEHLRIQTPLYPLAISYGRIKGIRPSPLSKVHDPSTQKRAMREWLRPYWARTVLVVELSEYPLPMRWLRLWFSPFFFSTTGSGVVLLVKDWMALSAQLQDYGSAWQTRATERWREKQARRLY